MKCIRSSGATQSPHVQPISANARTVASPGSTMRGRNRERSTRRRQLGYHQIALGVRIAERVDVDGEPIGMRGPVRLPAGWPADERASAVAVAGRWPGQLVGRADAHLVEWELPGEELTEDLPHAVGNRSVDEHLAGVCQAVEAPERQGQVAQRVGGDRASGRPGAAGEDVGRYRWPCRRCCLEAARRPGSAVRCRPVPAARVRQPAAATGGHRPVRAALRCRSV